MKKLTVLLSGLLILITSQMALAQPKFESLTDTIYEFGTVNQGASVSHQLIYRNAGDDTLYISKIKGS